MKIMLGEIMKDQGLTFERVRDLTGVSTHTLNNLVNGVNQNGQKRNPANIGLESTLGALCDALGVTPNDLLKPGEHGLYGKR